jgi:hypothetical protein
MGERKRTTQGQIAGTKEVLREEYAERDLTGVSFRRPLERDMWLASRAHACAKRRMKQAGAMYGTTRRTSCAQMVYITRGWCADIHRSQQPLTTRQREICLSYLGLDELPPLEVGYDETVVGGLPKRPPGGNAMLKRGR